MQDSFFIYLNTIDSLFDYITPAILASEFEREKLIFKLSLIAEEYPETVKIIQKITNKYLKDFSLTNKQKTVWMPDYYSPQEIKEINKIFGLSPNNQKITLNDVELGYQQNMNIPKAKELYYKLFVAHFQDKSIYSHPDINQLTNLSDEVFYAEENSKK
jgi:hypothetical protein